MDYIKDTTQPRQPRHRRMPGTLTWLLAATLVAAMLVDSAGAIETEAVSMEAAFQGRCGSRSPCMQLCYELHDGMYECDCSEGYELNKNGYSCDVINSTYQFGGDEFGRNGAASGANGLGVPDAADVLYQRDASFIARLDIAPNASTYDDDVSYSLSSNAADGDTDDESDETFDAQLMSNDIEDDTDVERLPITGRPQRTTPAPATTLRTTSTASTTVGTSTTTATTTTTGQPYAPAAGQYYALSMEDMSVYDDVNNNRLNLPSPGQQQQLDFRPSTTMTAALAGVSSSFADGGDGVRSTHVPDAFASSSSSSSSVTPFASDSTSHSYIRIDVYDDKAATLATPQAIAAETITSAAGAAKTTTSSSSRTTSVPDQPTASTISLETTRAPPCELDCGPDGVCDNSRDVGGRCLCPFGRAGNRCEETASKLNTPRFANHSWMAFPALRGAYKHVQMYLEFRPETFDGILLLTGERDDLTGDFMAVLIHQGFIEFWFDCGSGTGKVRSDETVQLNQWNSITVYRHRWDAWIQLNQGSRVQGRSKGLFSRITFREPVFLGGTGNITGLARKLPVLDGLRGCIRKFVANDHEYEFAMLPHGDVTQGFDVQECTQDRCGRYPCRHGGKCLPSDQGAICLCPLGFGGDLCEMRLDLQVPSFNGSSYLRFAPLGDSSLIWFELKMIIKPQSANGLLLYSGHHEYGDYISLCLNSGYVEFAFDLGSGTAVVKSEQPLVLGRWHTIKVSRTARLAVLKVNQLPEVMTVSPNGFWHLSLPHSVFLGGVQNALSLPASIREHGSFVGCIQKVEINGRSVAIIAEALGGTNVDNCPHACVARPCGALATCVPTLDNYECICASANAQCNQAEEVPSIQINVAQQRRQLELKRNITQTLRRLAAAQPTDTATSTAVAAASTTLPTDADLLRTHVIKTASEIIVASSSDSVTIIDHLRVGRREDAEELARRKKQEEAAEEDGAEQARQIDEDDDEYQADQPAVDGDAEADSSYDDDDDYYYDETVSEMATDETTTGATMSTTTTTTPAPTTTTTQRTTTPETTTPASPTTSTDSPLIVEHHQYSANRIHGRYLSVDNDRLIQMDQNLRLRKPYTPYAASNAKDSTRNRKSKKAPLSTGVKKPKLTKAPQIVYENVIAGPAPAQTQQEDLQTTQELLDDMERIMKNGNDYRARAAAAAAAETGSGGSGKRRVKQMLRRSRGACFTGADSYFHYNDAETMRQIISYQIDLNLRFKTHSVNGLLLWTGRHSALEEDDYLSLGIENGYLHLRYNLGSGDVNIQYNTTRVSDGLWHRIRAFRNLQEGSLEVDGGKSIVQRSPGKLRQLNTDTGLYVGGMPDVLFYTRRRYASGIVGCISEIVLTGELRLSLDPETLGTAHNVEPGIF